MAPISSNNGVNSYITAGWQQASPLLKQAGLDPKYSNQIGHILSGNADALITDVTDGVIDAAFGENTVGGAIAKGVADIVKIVIMGNYNKGADIKEAEADLQTINNAADTSAKLADEGQNASEEVLTQLQSNIDSSNTEISEASNQVIETLENSSQQTVELSEQNQTTAELIEQNQEQIDTNNKEIEAKQAQLEVLAEKIASKKAELKIGSGSPAPAPAPSGDGGNGESSGIGSNFVPMNMDGINDPELQSLMQEYNALGIDIAGLQAQNVELGNQNAEYMATIQNNTETAQQDIETSIEISDQQAAYIDEQTNNIVSMCNNAKSAINEIQNLLQGQFPKLDKIAVVKMATAMTKSAICGTNGGVLAAAASAMGVSSVVSFGSTAAKAAELGAASADQFAASTKNIATNVAGKLIQQQMMAYVNQTFANISQMTGVDLSQMQSLMTEFVQEQASVRNDATMAYQQTIEENPTETNVA